MKKHLIVFILFMAVVSYVSGQTRSIRFEEGSSWKKIVKKSKEENKLIFVDCYADWCGPCKRLASEVFTKDQVADFFNDKFINVSFNIEKDEDGKVLAQTWKVTALPTLLFIDPTTEQPVHRLVGFGDASWLISGATTALDPDKQLNAMVARYNKGERNPAFMIQLVKLYQDADMKDELEKVTREFLGGLTVDQLATPLIWPLIVQYENDPLSKSLLAVRDHKEKFYALPGQRQKEMVDAKLLSAVVGKAVEFATNPNIAVYDQVGYNAFIDYLDKADEPGKSMAAVWLNTSLLSREGDWQKMLEVMRTVKDEQLLPAQLYGQYFMLFIQSLAKMDDKKAVDAGVEWLDELITETQGDNLTTYSVRATMYGAKANLLQAAGKWGEAQKAKKEMDINLKLVQAQGGNVPN